MIGKKLKPEDWFKILDLIVKIEHDFRERKEVYLEQVEEKLKKFKSGSLDPKDFICFLEDKIKKEEAD